VTTINTKATKLTKLEPSISFEFFPPRTQEGGDKLKIERDQLVAINPDYFSVTYGAGGTTRDNTLDTVVATQQDSGIETAPHLSCIGDDQAHVAQLLTTYKQKGVRKIVALRGDLPSGTGAARGDFTYARDLVAFIRQTTGDDFHIQVAAYPEMHPQGVNYNFDFQNFVDKVNAGANGAITQYFYNADAYEHFLNLCQRKGVTVPIVPGIMPITNYAKLARFSQMCGAQIPRWLEKQLIAYADDSQAICQLGEEVVTTLCEKLLQLGAPSFHFYTLNRAAPSLAICKNLGLGVYGV